MPKSTIYRSANAPSVLIQKVFDMGKNIRFQVRGMDRFELTTKRSHFEKKYRYSHHQQSLCRQRP